MTKLYMLYEAVDTRDNKPMLWLIDVRADRVALFHTKTAVSRIKRLTIVAPGGIWWESSKVLDFVKGGYDDICSRKLIATWEF